MALIEATPREAFGAFERAAETGDKEWVMWWALGGFLSGFGHPMHVAEAYQRALMACERQLAQNPNDSEVWRVKGQTLSEMDRHVEALEAYERALTIDPKDAETLLEEVRLTEFVDRRPLDLGPSQRRAAAERLVDQQLIRNEIEIGEYSQPSASEAEATLRRFRQEQFNTLAQYRDANAIRNHRR
jgi:tetratricopeptide (TPR) repeat protein